MKEMLKRKRGGVLGMHPLFGPLVSSIKGQTIVFCKGRNNFWVDFLKKIFEKNGGKVVMMDAKKHDRQMAMIQAMTHFVNIVFAKVLQKQNIAPENLFSTPVFRLQAMLMGRILGANAALYADLEIENGSFPGVLKDFIMEAEKLSGIVLKKDAEKFEQEFSLATASMKDFIPVSQVKTSEIISILDKQPVEIKKQSNKKNIIPGKLTVACLGPEGTYSHLALQEIFPQSGKAVLTSSIREVFAAVASGEAELGVVPAENIIGGIVQETIDCLMDYPLMIIGSHKMKIRNCLLARTEDLSVIRKIKSHPQPLGQCHEWINKNFPQAILETDSSTARAILSTQDECVAFIGNEQAAHEYGLQILARDIENNANNITEFYIIGRGLQKKLSKKLKVRHTAIIATVYNRPGMLRDLLDLFAKRNLNLVKLHSRASSVKAWDYYFFLEVDCLPEDAGFTKAITEVEKICSIARVLGVV